MKRVNIVIIIIIIVLIILGVVYFQTSGKEAHEKKCEFLDREGCDISCEIDSDCKLSIGTCVNINEDVALGEGIPAYEVFNCSCEENKCVGEPTGDIAI